MAETHEIIVAETDVPRSESPYQNRIDTPAYNWIADEPEDLGGTGTGPDPYDMLLGALGACTSMTVRMYADRKGWPVEKIRVGLTHHKKHLKDCEDCEATDGKTGFVDEIEREVEIIGDLTEEQRARLLEIANKCPVHRTLTENVIKVRTRAV